MIQLSQLYPSFPQPEELQNKARGATAVLVKTSKSKSNILLVKKTELCKDSNARAHRGAHTELKEFLQSTAFFLKDAFIKLTYIHSDTYT